MDTKQYTTRIEELGYKADDALVAAVETAHCEQLTDALIDQAYADFRRSKNKPLASSGEPATARRGRPANKLAKTPVTQIPGGGGK